VVFWVVMSCHNPDDHEVDHHNKTPDLAKNICLIFFDFTS
jgi:hypothetical protein